MKIKSLLNFLPTVMFSWTEPVFKWLGFSIHPMPAFNFFRNLVKDIINTRRADPNQKVQVTKIVSNTHTHSIVNIPVETKFCSFVLLVKILPDTCGAPRALECLYGNSLFSLFSFVLSFHKEANVSRTQLCFKHTLWIFLFFCSLDIFQHCLKKINK